MRKVYISDFEYLHFGYFVVVTIKSFTDGLLRFQNTNDFLVSKLLAAR